MTMGGLFYNLRNNALEYVMRVFKSGSDAGFGLICQGTNTNDPLAAFKYVGAYAQSTVVGFNVNTWQQGAGVYSTTASRICYINGVAGATNTTTVNVAGATSIRFGAGADGSGTAIEFLNGRLAEIALWSAALNADEIVSLHKGFKPQRIRPQSLVVYVPLVRNLQDLRDGLALTNNNTATVTDHPRVY